jgi:glutamate synthase domain-containing protein 3
VRNSGATAVVEGVGDHGCEYMTKGIVVILGRAGRNFAAGMSGGVAYVLDEDGTFATRINKGMVEVDPMTPGDRQQLRALVERHQALTGSAVAARLLADWDRALAQFRKVLPTDYKAVLARQHLDGDAARVAAV